MSDHQNMEDLFRSKLGDAEITPSEGAWKGVLQKLRIKQFLRFDAGRFNIWYMGALLVAGAAAVTLLNSSPSVLAEEEQREIPVTEELQETDRVSDTRVEEKGEPLARPEISESGKPGKESENKQKKIIEPVNRTEEPAEPEESIITADRKEEKQESSLGAQEPSPDRTVLPRFTASVTEGCAPLKVVFVNSSVNSIAQTWSFGTGEGSEELNPVYLYEEAGVYAVSMKASGADGQTGKTHQVIRVHPSPVANLEMGEGFENLDGAKSMELMNYSAGGFSSSWDMLSADGTQVGGWSSNEFQPTLSNNEISEDAHMIRMVVLNEYGCTDTALAEITSMKAEERTLTFPTVFSANRTGPTGGHYSQHELRIDVFHPHFSEEPAEYQMKIYSKMGDLIFETRDILQGWDGYYQQDRTAGGVYLWVCSGKWQNGTTFRLKGDVTLLWIDRR